jgi:hypothetical protein
MRAQQRRFDGFLEEYNNERPHEAIGQATPSSLYLPSERILPKALPELEYPEHFEICRTYANGVITWRGSQWDLSGCLKNELVGLDNPRSGRNGHAQGPFGGYSQRRWTLRSRCASSSSRPRFARFTEPLST